MSGQPTTHGMRHLPEAHKSARGTAGLGKPFAALSPSKCSSVLLTAQKPDKMAKAA
ncbi:hypothetical protein [Mesorhizobium japonicum]|uniref:hypothetical protein n=1 Tax=Mesorhizobium japonicum TaxID=2066070 RepID=UPI0012FE8B13|nr:hypothetical protein [Mesorhizobium japonicum]